MSVIDIQNVKKSFHGNLLFENLNLRIERGKSYGLVGPNGSGKSVLLKLICGFMEPDQGVVTIDPRYLSGNRTFPDKFGAVIDGPAYLAHLSGLENLLSLASIRKTIGVDEVRAALVQVGLNPSSPQKVRRYSLGMKQKLSLAQAFMESPEVLILDEPFNALDESSAANVREILLDQKSQGTTLIFTSHNREDIDALSDEVLTISGNSIKLSTNLDLR